MISDLENYHLSLVMTEDYSTLEKQQLIDLVEYLLKRNYEYYCQEIDKVFSEEVDV